MNSPVFQAGQKQRNRILLRTGWETSTYEDLTMIPAIYRSIQRYVPNTEVIIWPSKMNDAITTIMEKNFTQITLVNGTIDEAGRPDNPELQEAFDTSNLLLYAAGSNQIIDWGNIGEGNETASLGYCRKINLPFIIYGLGQIPERPEIQEKFKEITSAASLVFVTNPQSEEKIKNQKIRINNLESAADPIFAFDLKNDSGARDFLENADLDGHDFIALSLKDQRDPDNDSELEREKIKFLLENWMDNNDHYLLLFPDSMNESTPEVNELYHQLPDPVKSRTIIYSGSFSPDMISSILEKSRITAGLSPYPLFSALVSDIPVFYCGSSSSDPAVEILGGLGLKDYCMDINKATGKNLFENMAAINQSYVKALLDVNKASETVNKQLEKSFGEIHKLLEKVNPAPKKNK